MTRKSLVRARKRINSFQRYWNSKNRIHKDPQPRVTIEMLDIKTLRFWGAKRT